MGRVPGPTGRARERVLRAARELFAEHGISGTSLQMIADRMGVTKAAVYHQFPAKDEIALGLLEEVFAALDALVVAAREAPVGARQDVVIEGTVRMMVGQRQVMSALYRDPEMERLVSQDAGLSATRRALDEVLHPVDSAVTRRRRLGWAVLGAGFTRAVVDPQFGDLPEEELTTELIALAHRILD